MQNGNKTYKLNVRYFFKHQALKMNTFQRAFSATQLKF